MPIKAKKRDGESFEAEASFHASLATRAASCDARSLEGVPVIVTDRPASGSISHDRMSVTTPTQVVIMTSFVRRPLNGTALNEFDATSRRYVSDDVISQGELEINGC